jgi:hypothetical protein
MAGSKRWFNYDDDFGVTYAIERDESLTEAVNDTAATTPSGGADVLPRSVEPRVANYNSADGRFRRTVTILTPGRVPDTPLAISLTQAAEAVTMQLTSIIGEKRRVVTSTDTLQTDGDVEGTPPTLG